MITTDTTKQNKIDQLQGNTSLLSSLMSKLHQSLSADISFIAKFQKSPEAEGSTIARTLLLMRQGELSDNISFVTENTPSQELVENRNCVISDAATSLHPDDPYLQENQISAFMGVPIRNNQGEPVGAIVVQYQNKLEATSRVISMLYKLSSQITDLLLSACNFDDEESTESDGNSGLACWNDEISKLFDIDPNTRIEHVPLNQITDSFEQSHASYLESIIDSLHDAIITTDQYGTIMSANKTAEKLFECNISDLVGHKVSSLMSEPYASLHKGFMQNYLEKGNNIVLGKPQELPAKRKGGQEFPMEISISEVEQGNEKIFIGIIRDISERKKAKDQIYELAYFDSLTQLPNRISFERDVLDVLSRAKLAHGNIYCSLLNIDRFAQINLTYGKTTGDFVLKKISRRIQTVLKRSFRLYKNVADSFFLLYRAPISPGDRAVEKEIRLLENSIQGAVSSQLSLKGNPQSLTMSIGSLNIQASEIDHYKLIRLLEFSEHRAKAQGQNSCFSLSSKEKALFERRTLISHSIIKGMERDEFYVELQPQYSREGDIVCSEVLIRWESEELGHMPPAEFIPLAEKNGDIVKLGNWVIDQACRLLAELKSRDNKSKIAINISGKQVMQPDFCQQLMRSLEEWDVDSSNLILEITESTLVKDVELVKEQMSYLASQGFSFSIDDFGTGYSSLIYLKELPIEELKIDRYFVDEIRDPTDDVSIVNTIIEMAKALKIRTVAEGIEKEAQLTYLMDRGCHYFQGFLLNRPMPVEKWLELLSEPKQYFQITEDYQI